MTARSTVHADFTIEREYPYPPERVFRAFADPDAKAMWFAEPTDQIAAKKVEFDFSVGGRERLAIQVVDGPAMTFDARYEDIVPNERIVTTYSMTVDGALMSVSVATTEFVPTDAGTRLVFTEMGAFLDGLDTNAQREAGSRELLEDLGRALERGAGKI